MSKQLDDLKKQVEAGRKAISDFSKQTEIYKSTLDIVGADITGDDKKILDNFKNKANNYINRAKNGSIDFNELVEEMNQEFKKYKPNGSNSNR